MQYQHFKVHIIISGNVFYDYMDQNYSWEANSHSANKEFPRLL
jgi:hypothetical protein